MKEQQDTVLVSYYKKGEGEPILVIGRKRVNESVEIINAFQGEEAEKLYKHLVEKGEGK